MKSTKVILSAVVVLLLVTLALAFSSKQSPSPEARVARAAEPPKAGGAPTAPGPVEKKLGVGATFAVIVNDVQPGSLAAQMNLAPGDMILDVNGQQFFSLAEFQSLVEASWGRHKFRVLRLNDSSQKEVFEVQPAPQ